MKITKAANARLNTARELLGDARRAVSCKDWDSAATNYMKAGRLFFKSGAWVDAVDAWRRACDFSEREANRIFQMNESSKLN